MCEKTETLVDLGKCELKVSGDSLLPVPACFKIP